MLTQTALLVFLASGQFELGAPLLDAPAALAPAEPSRDDAWAPPGRRDRDIEPEHTPPGRIQAGDDELTSLVAVDPAAPDSTLALLRDALQRECPRPLAGQPVSLAAALAAGSPRAPVIQAYWQLAAAAARYQFSVEETDFLFSLAEPAASHQLAVLTAVQTAAKAEEARDRLQALQAQQTLSASLPSGAGDPPLAGDLPFVGAYQTRYEVLVARGRASEPLRRIHHTLPALHELLRRQADAVFASGAAVGELRQAYEAGEVSLVQLLDSFRQLRQQRREFLASVLEYNEAIARYALAFASPGLPLTQVVGMLIDSPGDQRPQRSVLAVRRDGSPIRRVSNEEPIPAAGGEFPRQPQER